MIACLGFDLLCPSLLSLFKQFACFVLIFLSIIWPLSLPPPAGLQVSEHLCFLASQWPLSCCSQGFPRLASQLEFLRYRGGQNRGIFLLGMDPSQMLMGRYRKGSCSETYWTKSILLIYLFFIHSFLQLIFFGHCARLCVQMGA